MKLLTQEAHHDLTLWIEDMVAHRELTLDESKAMWIKLSYWLQEQAKSDIDWVRETLKSTTGYNEHTTL